MGWTDLALGKGASNPCSRPPFASEKRASVAVARVWAGIIHGCSLISKCTSLATQDLQVHDAELSLSRSPVFAASLGVVRVAHLLLAERAIALQSLLAACIRDVLLLFMCRIHA